MLKELEQIMKSRLPMPEKREDAKDIIKKYLNNESVENLISIVIRNRNSNELDGLLLIAVNELIEEKISELSEEDSVRIISKLEKKADELQHNINIYSERLLSEEERLVLYKKLSEDDSNYKRTLYNYSEATSSEDENKIAVDLARKTKIKMSEEEIKMLDDYKKTIERNLNKKITK